MLRCGGFRPTVLVVALVVAWLSILSFGVVLLALAAPISVPVRRRRCRGR